MNEDTVNDNVTTEPVPEIGAPAPHFMLNVAVIDRFKSAVTVKLPKINDTAVFMLRAVTKSVLAGWHKRLQVCPDCSGRGFVRLTAQERGSKRVEEVGIEVCPRCHGKSPKSWNDLEVRVAMMRDMVSGWTGLKAQDINTGELRDVAYTEEMRDTLADTPVFDVVFDACFDLAGKIAEDEAKN